MKLTVRRRIRFWMTFFWIIGGGGSQPGRRFAEYAPALLGRIEAALGRCGDRGAYVPQHPRNQDRSPSSQRLDSRPDRAIVALIAGAVVYLRSKGWVNIDRLIPPAELPFLPGPRSELRSSSSSGLRRLVFSQLCGRRDQVPSRTIPASLIIGTGIVLSLFGREHRL